MRKQTTIIGVIILVIGVVIAAAGGYSLKNSTTTVTTFTEPTTGEYVSSELNLNDSIVVLTHPASVGGIVSTQDVNRLNSSNISSYAIPSNTTTSSSDTFIGLQGHYNYVAFSSSQPTTKIVITGSLSGTVGRGLLVLFGGILAIIGIIVAVIGLVRRNPTRTPKAATTSDAEYYTKRDSGTPAQS